MVILGFSEDQFSHDDPSLGNKVYFVNEGNDEECDVIQYYTNQDKILCTTR